MEMSEKETGGQAFPHANPRYDGNWDNRMQIGGMTLRDYFAGQSLGTIINFCMDAKIDAKGMASVSYEIADAMLGARK
jgi:hypothetical protein